MSQIKKNMVVSVEVDDLAYGGMGVGRVDGFVFFIERALPGDLVRAKVFKKASNHAQCFIEELVRPSPLRIDAPCKLFGTCGGCAWQNLDYAEQLRWKAKQAAGVLRHISGQEIPESLPIIGSPNIWNYRNKMEFTFGTGKAEETILGFHYPGRFDRILEVPKCHIHPEPFDSILTALTSFARENNLSSNDPRTHRGLLRHAVVRHSATTGGVILLLITHEPRGIDFPALIEKVRAACPQIQGIQWGVNSGVADVASVQRICETWGNPVLKETVNGLTFSISPLSFFQTNTRGAELLYARTVEMAELTPQDRVLDAYCGTGSIGLHCARTVKRVVGVEVVRDAIWNARDNARANGIENATFIAAPMAGGLTLARQAAGGDFTRVIIDPPRGGMDKKSLELLIKLRAPVFVYVSCNPSTLARDLQTLGEAGYVVEASQPVDMFPHTHHIEMIVRLRLK